MANAEQTRYSVKSKLLRTAAKMFLEYGYSESTIREIAKNAGVNRGSLGFAFKTKEELLCELIGLVLECQFETTARLLKEKTEDKILFYAVETTLQLYMAENSEHIREMYIVSYSSPNSSQIIYHTITDKLVDIFREHLPYLEPRDFYEKEIASAGIMRNFLTVPCNMYFTMERKVSSFLESTFLVYEVPKEKIKETISFVSQFNLACVAQETLDHMLEYLESRI